MVVPRLEEVKIVVTEGVFHKLTVLENNGNLLLTNKIQKI